MENTIIQTIEFDRIRRILSHVRSAVDDYGMISDGDRIAVGVSGGKDSLTLLAALVAMKRFYPKKYELYAITVDMGFEGADFKEIELFCQKCGVPFRLVKTQLAHIIFDVRKESNPCSLCARMRRGIIHDTAKELECNKLALGHHFDDAVVTFMLNLFHEGRIGSFSPITYLSRKDLTMIRPLIYTPEKDIQYFVRHNDIPVAKSLCPEDKQTERENMQHMISEWERDYKGLRHRIFGAMQKSEIDGYGIDNSGPVVFDDKK